MKEEDVRIAGFGRYKTKRRPVCSEHNPQESESLTIPASKMSWFKDGKTLKDAVNGRTP